MKPKAGVLFTRVYLAAQFFDAWFDRLTMRAVVVCGKFLPAMLAINLQPIHIPHGEPVEPRITDIRALL